MAWVSQDFFFNLTLIDRHSLQTNMRFQLQSADYAAAIVDAAALVALIEAVTDSTSYRYEVTERFMNDAWALPGAMCYNSDKAILTLRIAGSAGKKASLAIPAPSIGIFMATSGPNADQVDVLDADVVALVAAFQSGGEAKLSDGELVAATDGLIRGRRSNRKYPQTIG